MIYGNAMKYAWFEIDGRQVYRAVREPVATRSLLPAPMIRPDGMSDTWNPVDGRHYDTKSGYERAVRQAGCEIVGNDAGHWNKPPPSREPTGIKEDIVRAMKGELPHA